MKKLLLPLALISLSLPSTAQDNVTSTDQRYEIEGLYLGMPKAAAEDEIAKFCLKNNGKYETGTIKGNYDIIFANSIGCSLGKYEYLYMRTAQDKIYDIVKSIYIDVEGNFENGQLLLERAKVTYQEPTLISSTQNNDKHLNWELDFQPISQMPESIANGLTSWRKFEGVSTIACWGQCTTTSVDNNVYVRSGTNALALILENGDKLRLAQRLTDIDAIHTAWEVYQHAENAHIDAEKAANKNIIDSVSF